MKNIAINHHSIHQYKKICDFEQSLLQIVNCLSYVIPLVKLNKLNIFYDEQVADVTCLISGESFVSCLSKVSDRDLRQKWYLYTRNNCIVAEGDSYSVAISSHKDKDKENPLLLKKDFFSNGVNWVSFDGLVFFSEIRYFIKGSGNNITEIRNAVSFQDFAAMWPIYEASPKHKKEGYYRSKGVYVSPMTLSHDEAQSALLSSIEIRGERFARVGNKYVRYLKTYIDKEIYHGFEIDKDNFPDDQ